jgi:hypothetical protein
MARQAALGLDPVAISQDKENSKKLFCHCFATF